jgi:Uma2 family endonuclease
MSLHEIVLPETEPETEWILGHAVQKVSPFRTHSLLQTKLTVALFAWAQGRGEVGTEWRFRVAPPGEVRRPLVPDVAFVSNDRLAGLIGRDLEAPPFAPNVAVEVLSPDDVARRVAHKNSVYLASGSELVIVVDSRDRTIRLHDHDGVRVLRGDDVLEHDALPGFVLALPELFRVIDRPR